MRTDQLLQRIRQQCTLEASHPDYTDAIILDECDDALSQTFENPIVDAHAGYWLKPFFYTTTAGVTKYRIPPRAIVCEKVDIARTGSRYAPLHQVTEDNSALFEMAPGQVGVPQAFAVRDGSIVLMPAPDSSAYSIRLWYYLRPSRLQAQQSSTDNSGVIRGRITAINTTTRALTVNALPFDQELAAPAAITSASQLVDVVKPDGWHEVVLIGASQTIAGLVITVGGTDDLSDIAVGDFVRVAEQTDWPALPDDFHRCLADVAGSKIQTQRDFLIEAGQLAGSCSADFVRFGNIIKPRVRTEAVTVRAPMPTVRRRWGYR